jgi:hypothetical protein
LRKAVLSLPTARFGTGFVSSQSRRSNRPFDCTLRPPRRLLKHHQVNAMNPHPDQSVYGASEAFAVLTRELQIRVVNCSLSGCLFETSTRLPVGTVAALTLRIDGHEFEDDVRVTRCDGIAGAGERYHIGAEFLWTALPSRRSLRFAMQQRLTTPMGVQPGV